VTAALASASRTARTSAGSCRAPPPIPSQDRVRLRSRPALPPVPLPAARRPVRRCRRCCCPRQLCTPLCMAWDTKAFCTSRPSSISPFRDSTRRLVCYPFVVSLPNRSRHGTARPPPPEKSTCIVLPFLYNDCGSQVKFTWLSRRARRASPDSLPWERHRRLFCGKRTVGCRAGHRGLLSPPDPALSSMVLRPRAGKACSIYNESAAVGTGKHFRRDD
jgi:hypothetical protein